VQGLSVKLHEMGSNVNRRVVVMGTYGCSGVQYMGADETGCQGLVVAKCKKNENGKLVPIQGSLLNIVIEEYEWVRYVLEPGHTL